jgi:hypothetical protein
MSEEKRPSDIRSEKLILNKINTHERSTPPNSNRKSKRPHDWLTHIHYRFSVRARGLTYFFLVRYNENEI